MDSVIAWLLAGDVSIQYLTRKYLLNEAEQDLVELRRKIAQEGWGQAFLSARQETGHWGKGFYQTKWISSHYTLLDLKNLEIQPVKPIMDTLQLILTEAQAPDGSINESHSCHASGDICVNGMFLNYAAFFGVAENQLQPIVDYLLANVMPDGGFNCAWKRSGAHHSSMHSTISVLEGFREFTKAGYSYRASQIAHTVASAEEMLLQHHLFRSDKTGKMISKQWLMLSYPSRWHYDILRALVYFADAGHPYDPRMAEAIAFVSAKRRKDGTWPVQAKHPGEVHFVMEKTGGPSRFNTLRALRVLKAYPQS